MRNGVGKLLKPVVFKWPVGKVVNKDAFDLVGELAADLAIDFWILLTRVADQNKLAALHVLDQSPNGGRFALPSNDYSFEHCLLYTSPSPRD